MRPYSHSSRRLALVLLTGFVVATGSAQADKPSWAGSGKPGHKGEERREVRHEEPRHDDRRVSVGIRFGDDSRRLIHEYYGVEFRAGRCPPGLAKKKNGCLPPGQAKKWVKGHPLPADLRYYDLPRDLLVRLPPPPRDHRYVQVAGDILMIAVGTALVVDAIEDLGR
jgi:Ni/Co efflux regulator RcnB